MEDPKVKKPQKDQETIKPEGDTKEEGELSEKDLEKAAGGTFPKLDQKLC